METMAPPLAEPSLQDHDARLTAGGAGCPGTVPGEEASMTMVVTALSTSVDGFIAGIERAVEQARTAAGGKDVALMGANVVQQCLRAGLLDEFTIHQVPVLLGRGVRLLDGLEPSVELELVGVVDAPGVTHLTYRVLK